MKFSWIRNCRHELVLLVLLICICFAASLLVENFMTMKSQLYLSRQLWEMALLAIPMTLIILTGGIDLSVGSIMGLCATCFGLVWKSTQNIFLASLASLVVGVVCGGLNGFFITRWKLHPLIVTLATYAAFRGMGEGISQGEAYSGFPSEFASVGRGQWFGLAPGGWLFILLALVVWIWLLRTTHGRNIYAIGLNRQASTGSGIPVRFTEFCLYVFSGLMGGVVTVIYVSRFNTAKADAGTLMELDVITAVVVGGTSIFGGRGSVPGTVLGLLLIHQTRMFVGRYWQVEELKSIITGVLLILSVLMSQIFISRKSGRQ